MEVLVYGNNHSSDDYTWSRTTTPASIISDVSTSDNSTYISRSNNLYCPQSPLTKHRFMSAPYSGTGYLPQVIRSPNFNENLPLKNVSLDGINADNLSDKMSNSD